MINWKSWLEVNENHANNDKCSLKSLLRRLFGGRRTENSFSRSSGLKLSDSTGSRTVAQFSIDATGILSFITWSFSSRTAPDACLWAFYKISSLEFFIFRTFALKIFSCNFIKLSIWIYPAFLWCKIIIFISRNSDRNLPIIMLADSMKRHTKLINPFGARIL